MAICEVDAVLVKVAGVGLGTQQLGKSLVELRPLLERLVGHGQGIRRLSYRKSSTDLILQGKEESTRP